MIDIKDVSFVALTIESKGLLWTGDKKLHMGLKERGFDQVANLDELKIIINSSCMIEYKKT